MASTPLRLIAPMPERAARYGEVLEALRKSLGKELGFVKVMTETVKTLHETFEYFDWTGFYVARPGEMLELGPYLGGHGCLNIPFSRGVCGAAARGRETMLVHDVHKFVGHIACASTTNSEIVVPVLSPQGQVLAVLDVDSDVPAAFTNTDQAGLEAIAGWLGERHPAQPATK